MQLVRRMATAGLAVMAGVALATEIWPGVAGLVTGLLVTVLGAGGGVPVVLSARWVRGELAWRRQLATMPQAEAALCGLAPVASTLAGLQESA